MLKEFQENYREKWDQKPVFRHKAALEFIKKYSIKDFIDLGCWNGIFLEYVKKYSWIVGRWIELSDYWVNEVKKKWFEVYNADIVSDSFDQKTDVVVCLDVLEHIFNPGEVVKKIHSITQKYLIVSVPNFNSITARFQVLFWNIPENNTERKGHCYRFNLSLLKKTLQNNGFDIIEIKTNTIGWLTFLSKLFPSLFALSFVVLCKKKI